MIDAGSVARTLAAIREKRPLVHNITNLVVTNTTANALLALGASPAMVHCPDEVEEFTAISGALVVNVGTIDPTQAAAMRLATRAAQAASVPWILDPVAVGVLRYRTELARDLLQHRPAVIRGNASEVIGLEGAPAGGGHGVDATASSQAARPAAERLARATGVVVAVTGAVDYVSDGKRTVAVHNGHAMMTRVTGLGCTATALIGACLAVQPDRLAAAVHGLAFIGVAGEIAAERARGPGSLQLELYDALYRLDEATLAERLNLTE